MQFGLITSRRAVQSPLAQSVKNSIYWAVSPLSSSISSRSQAVFDTFCVLHKYNSPRITYHASPISIKNCSNSPVFQPHRAHVSYQPTQTLLKLSHIPSKFRAHITATHPFPPPTNLDIMSSLGRVPEVFTIHPQSKLNSTPGMGIQT